MKSTGIVRKVDELGRIVLPVELRRTMDIAEKDPLEIYVDGNSIVLRKYRPSCIFCDSTKDVRTFRGKNVCPRCLRELRERTYWLFRQPLSTLITTTRYSMTSITMRRSIGISRSSCPRTSFSSCMDVFGPMIRQSQRRMCSMFWITTIERI